MSELKRKKLQDLRFETPKVVVVALIIGKTNPRSFVSKRSANTQAVVNFTVRDSKQFFTNCVCWGSETQIQDYNCKFRIGDVIDIISPQISPISQSARAFYPQTSTPFCLTINEENASIGRHMFDTAEINAIRSLAREPIKPVSLALNLADVRSSGGHHNGQYVDLFVVVRHFRPIRTLKSKATGQNVRCLEMVVMDRSYPTGMSFSIWQEEWIERAEKSWKVNKTVLYLIDAKLNYSTFYKQTVISYTGKTVILEDLAVKEAGMLVEFAATVPLNAWDTAVQGYPNPESITNVMTVQQIYDRCNRIIHDDSEQFTAVLYAAVTRFDLDGFSRSVAKKCKFCKRPASLQQTSCSSDKCQMNISFDNSGDHIFDFYFDVNLHLTDHTGTLKECRLINNFAEMVLGCNVQDFQKMHTVRKTDMKWEFLMERVCAKLIVKKKTVTRINLFVMVLEMKVVELDDVAGKILVY